MNSKESLTVPPPPDEATEEVAPLPWQLKVVAFLFIAAGTHAAFTMIAGLFHDSLYLRLHVFGLLVGLGLLKRKKGSLSCAGSLLILGLITTGLGAILLAVLRKSDYLRIQGAAFAYLPWYVSVLLVACFFLLFWWMMRVLDRQKTAEASSHYPRGAAWVITGAIIVAFAAGGAGEYVRWRANPEMVSSSSTNQQGLWLVSYACVFDELSYAVFQHAPIGEGLSSAVRASILGNNRRAWLKMPDGSEMSLPNKHRLYEFKDGKLLTSDAHVTREEFEAFMASSPDEYTIDALLEFLSNSDNAGRRRTPEE